jgi:hypothetical protein
VTGKWGVDDVNVLRRFVWAAAGGIGLLPVRETRGDEGDRTQKKNDSGEAEERLVVPEHDFTPSCDEVDPKLLRVKKA